MAVKMDGCGLFIHKKNFFNLIYIEYDFLIRVIRDRNKHFFFPFFAGTKAPPSISSVIMNDRTSLNFYLNFNAMDGCGENKSKDRAFIRPEFYFKAGALSDFQSFQTGTYQSGKKRITLRSRKRKNS
jgi:hypothetical protein